MLRTGLAAAFLAIVSGCALGDAPLRQLELSGTEWAIVRVDQQQLVAPIQLEFVDRYTARLHSACGISAADYAVDTDGTLLEFTDFEDREIACDEDEQHELAVVADALASITDWEIVDDDSIRLRGAQVIELQRTSDGDR